MRRALIRSEIPDHLKELRVLDHDGTTSIALEKDSNTAIILTRDWMKKEWLHHGLAMVSSCTVHEPKIRRNVFSGFSIYAIEMPKLQKISSPKGEKIVSKEVEFWNRMSSKINSSDVPLKDVQDYYCSRGMKDSMIGKVLRFLDNYDETLWSLDIWPRQFLEDSEGQIFLVDPIYCNRLYEARFRRQ